MTRVIPIFLIIYLCTISISTAYQIGLNVESEPVNLFELNSKSDEFAPRWNQWEKRIYFNSTITGSSQFYTSELTNMYSAPALVKGPLNQSGDNRSYITFANSGEAFLAKFTNFGRRPYLNLHRSVYVKNGWSAPEHIQSLKFESFVSHPTISPDGNMLVFVTDLYNDNNDTDLWMCWRREDNTWTEPIPIDELNSHGSEITPFLMSSDTLLFASNGYEGPGGYDIFYSVFINDRWERPRPIAGVNTEFDESDPSVFPDRNFLFASNRPGGVGGLDLYSAKLSQVDPMYSEFDEVKLNLQFQVSNINIERQTINYTYPMLNSIPKIVVDKLIQDTLTKGNIYVQFLLHISELLQKNLEMQLITESNEHGRRLSDLLMTWNVSENQIKMSENDGRSNELTLSVLNCSECNVIQAKNLNYNLKPEMLDIAMSVVNAPADYELDFIAEFKHKSELINLESDTLPQRFFLPLAKYADYIYSSDNVEFILKIKQNDDILNSIYKNLYVTLAETNEDLNYIFNNSLYLLYPIPSFEGKLSSSTENLNKLFDSFGSNFSNKSKCIIFYTEEINASVARNLAAKLKSRFSSRQVSIQKIKSEDLPSGIDSQNAIFIGLAN
jgi:hypothetical protein